MYWGLTLQLCKIASRFFRHENLNLRGPCNLMCWWNNSSCNIFVICNSVGYILNIEEKTHVIKQFSYLGFILCDYLGAGDFCLKIMPALCLYTLTRSFFNTSNKLGVVCQKSWTRGAELKSHFFKQRYFWKNTLVRIYLWWYI